MARYIIGIDQSTQGTKVMLLDGAGVPVRKAELPHHQYIDGHGWVEHDPEEIWKNLL